MVESRMGAVAWGPMAIAPFSIPAHRTLMVVPHVMTFPGALLTDQTLVGGSRQATGYIFVSWVTGFALLTFVSVIFEARASHHQFALVRVDRAVCTAVCAVSVVVVSVTESLAPRLSDQSDQFWAKI